MSRRNAETVIVGAALAAVFWGCGSDPAGSSDGASGGGQTAVGGASVSASGAAGTSSSGAGASGLSEGSAARGGLASGGTPNSAGRAGQELGQGGAVAGGAAAGGATAGHGGVGASAGASGGSLAGAAGQPGAAGAGGALGKVTIWIAGDSTVATGGPCPIGWGGRFKALFNDRVTVNNSAVAGRSVRTWLYDVQDSKDSSGECNLGQDAQGNATLQTRWTAMLTGMKAGDYLLIQFGINDGDSTCPRHVGKDAFETSYGMMAQAAKDRGAFPVFVTPVSQIACSGSTVSKGTREPYVSATKEAGTRDDVPVIDLNLLSATLYQSLGFCPIPGGDVSASTTGAVGTFFCDDHTHFDTTGATQIAGLVAGALRSQNIPLSQYLL